MRFKKAASVYLVWMVAFIVIPLLIVVYFAVTNAQGEFTINNIVKALDYIPTLIKSVYLSLIATAICLVVSYPIAFIMSRANSKNQRVMLMFIMLPMWMNYLLRTYAWMTLLEDTGLINRFFGLFSLGPFNLINTEGAVVLGMVYNFLPFMILPLYSVMVKIHQETIEAAQDLGANSVNIFSRIVIPLSYPGISSGITMVFVPSVSTFIISKMLGGGGNLLIGDIIELQFLGNAYNPNLGAAIALVMMAVVLIILSVLKQFDRDGDQEGMLL